MNKIKAIPVVLFMFIIPLGEILLSQYENSITYDPETAVWYHSEENAFSDNSLFIWQFIQTPVNSQITDIIFTGSSNGYASHSGMGVIYTTNTGINWTAVSFNDTNFTTGFNGVHFINVNTGWAVGGALQIRKTTNGGAAWVRQIPPPVAGILRSVYFTDASTGYAAGSKSFPYIPFIAKTTNSGANWVEISPSVSGARELNDMYWFNSGTGWIAGYDVLLYTTNGGTSFTNYYANIPPSGNGHISLLAINFVNTSTGWIGAANLERNNVYKTTNGGVNWVFQDNPISQGGMNQINDVLFINSDSGWAVHGTPFSGAIMFTSNGGANWAIDEQSVNWFDCLAYVPNSRMYCGSSSGLVWYTGLLTGISAANGKIPRYFSLNQNYPNPFNPSTNIEFSIPSNSYVNIKIFDHLGRVVKVIAENYLAAGNYKADFDGSGLSSGVYYCRMQAGDFTQTIKMILAK